MERIAGRILKSDDVKLQGQFRLDVNPNVQCATGEKNRASASSQVRIVENHPDYAIIEFTCCCGTKTSVRCDYAAK